MRYIHDVDEMLTPAEAARALHMSPSRLRAISEEGAIYSQKTPGGHRRYPAKEVERLKRVLALVQAPHLPVAARAQPAHEQLRAVWSSALDWVEQQARPLVYAAFAQIEDPGCRLEDNWSLTGLAFDMPDGRVRYCRFGWSAMLYVLGEHMRTGQSLEELSWAYSNVHSYAMPERLRERLRCVSPYQDQRPGVKTYEISRWAEQHYEPVEAVLGLDDALRRAGQIAHETVALMSDMHSELEWSVQGEDEARRDLQLRHPAAIKVRCKGQPWRDVHYSITAQSP